MSPQKVVIFDFDGTLADTVPIIRAIYDDVAKKNKLTAMTDEDYLMLRKGTIGDARKWSGIHWWQWPMIVRSMKKLIAVESEKVRLFPGVVDMINELHDNDVEVYILSRNLPEVIERTLERYKQQKRVHILHRRKRSLGSKASVIKKLVRTHNIDAHSVWMIGDEVRDIQAANRAGVQSVAVTWGLQDESILLKYKPTKIVSTIDQLRAVLRDT